MNGRWGIEGFPEPVSPGHWGGYDGLAGHAYGPAQWGPVRDRLTYLAGFASASAQLGDLCGYGEEDLRRLAEACSGILYSLTDGGGTLDGGSLALVLGAAEDAHFHDNPDEGVRFGCPTCDALLEVHYALGLPPTQWVRAWLVDCYRHEDCPGCPREPECDMKNAELLTKARAWAEEVSRHCRVQQCTGCPEELECRAARDDGHSDQAIYSYPDELDDDELLERYGEKREA